jgi:predicted dehydrogenase
MHKWRYHPGIEALRDIARSQELGPVVSIRTFRLGWANPHSDVDASWILMPHDLSIALEILGYVPDPVFASAEYFNSELTGLLGILGECPRLVAEVSARSATPLRSISVGFRDGTATLEDSYSRCIQVRRALSDRARPDDPVESRPIPAEMPLERELRAFLGFLEGGPPPKTSAAESVRIVEVISRLRQLADVQGG